MGFACVIHLAKPEPGDYSPYPVGGSRTKGLLMQLVLAFFTGIRPIDNHVIPHYTILASDVQYMVYCATCLGPQLHKCFHVQAGLRRTNCNQRME